MLAHIFTHLGFLSGLSNDIGDLFKFSVGYLNLLIWLFKA